MKIQNGLFILSHKILIFHCRICLLNHSTINYTLSYYLASIPHCTLYYRWVGTMSCSFLSLSTKLVLHKQLLYELMNKTMGKFIFSLCWWITVCPHLAYIKRLWENGFYSHRYFKLLTQKYCNSPEIHINPEEKKASLYEDKLSVWA